MKKFLLSIAVIISFGLYAINQRKSTSAQDLVVQTSPPQSVASSNNSQSSSASSGSATPANTNVNSGSSSQQNSGAFKDGSYTGVSADAFYGNVQVQAVISGGKMINVKFLDYPQDRGHSVEINNYARPILTQEAIQAQSSNVDIVSGATATSEAFIQSLRSALAKA